MAVHQFVIFKIDNEDYGLDIKQVREIDKPMDIYKIPNFPEYIEGLINLRGHVHTVFNLRNRFSLPNKASDDNSRIIIVNIDSIPAGIIVDEVNEIKRVEEESIENTPALVARQNSRFLSGIAKVDDKIIFLLNLEEVLSLSKEKAAKG